MKKKYETKDIGTLWKEMNGAIEHFNKEISYINERYSAMKAATEKAVNALIVSTIILSVAVILLAVKSFI